MLRTTLAALLLATTTTAQHPPPDYGHNFITIGDAGNPGWNREDPTMFFGGRGAVDYEYRISEREVETRDWLEFTNTFTTQSDELADFIGTPQRWGGKFDDFYTGPGDRYILSPVIADAGRQHIDVSWRQAAYYVNWLHNGKSSDPSAIMSGAYDVSTFGFLDDGLTLTDQTAHDPDAKFWIPTLDEWTKAGHWDPNKNGPGDGGWWLYNHGSDSPPVTGLPGEPGAQTSAIDVVANPDITLDEIGMLANVPNGSYPETRSPWGLIDMTGGAGEWFEDLSNPDLRRRRRFSGGEAGGSTSADLAYFINGTRPTAQAASFRVASIVPAPGVGVILLLGGVASLSTRRR
ncbi:MAG: SUMF1/EgtB/PvdO family nonheme iron enzyme [Planctomycetota bacterium]